MNHFNITWSDFFLGVSFIPGKSSAIQAGLSALSFCHCDRCEAILRRFLQSQ